MDENQKKLAEELLFSEKKKRGFAQNLYFGTFDPSLAFPYPQVDKDELAQVEAYLAKVQAFVDSTINPEEIDRQASIPDEVIIGLGKLGVLGMTVPVENGGLGLSQYAYCKAVEIIAQKCSSTALFVNAHQSIGLKALVLFGTPSQRKQWLSRLAKGEMLAAFALTEPHAGSDASGIETRAVYDPQKKVYRLNGQKQWITNGSIAGLLTVMAKTEVETPTGKQDKVTAFIVTPDMPGFHIRTAALEKVGMRGSKTANLAFEDVQVPLENVLGPVGKGLKVCLTMLDYGRTTFGATCTGAGKMLLKKALQHANNRHQFNRPLASFALVKQKLATMAGLVYAMDATTYFTAGLIDARTEDIMLEAAMLKVFSSEALWLIVYETMQIYGGRSFFTDEPLERLMRDSRLNMIGEGSNEVLRAFIGVVGMRNIGMEMQDVQKALSNPFSDFQTLWKFGIHCLQRSRLPHLPIHESLQPEAKRLTKATRSFGFAITKLLIQYREEILEKQLLLDRIATSAIAIYTTTAVLGKLDAEIKELSVSPATSAAAKLYCHQAMDRVEQSLSALSHHRDEEIESVSDALINEVSAK